MHGRGGWLFTEEVCSSTTLPHDPNHHYRFDILQTNRASNWLTRHLSLSLSTAIFGPGATLWYRFLQKKINFPSQNLTIAARVLTDQTVFASTNLFLFLSSMALMEGSDPKAKLKKSYFPALEKNWMLWPAVQAFNFKFVPLNYQVLLVNFVSLGWNCYLSWVNSQA